MAIWSRRLEENRLTLGLVGKRLDRSAGPGGAGLTYLTGRDVRVLPQRVQCQPARQEEPPSDPSSFFRMTSPCLLVRFAPKRAGLCG